MRESQQQIPLLKVLLFLVWVFFIVFVIVSLFAIFIKDNNKDEQQPKQQNAIASYSVDIINIDISPFFLNIKIYSSGRSHQDPVMLYIGTYMEKLDKSGAYIYEGETRVPI